jgi:hypothetical protein
MAAASCPAPEWPCIQSQNLQEISAAAALATANAILPEELPTDPSPQAAANTVADASTPPNPATESPPLRMNLFDYVRMTHRSVVPDASGSHKATNKLGHAYGIVLDRAEFGHWIARP